MLLQVFKSKIHRVTVTGADLNYMGSISIGKDLLDASGILEGEKVQIVNVNNGARLETYTIVGEQGKITLNGPAARLVEKDDVIIIVAYAYMTEQEYKDFKPTIIFPNEKTNLLS